jgi:hypothetical protein
VLSNIFLGIIVDTFAEIRDEKEAYTKDVETKCFICQLTKEEAIFERTNFDEHIVKHNLWNYVYFITYLLTNDPYDFSQVEFEVYNKLKADDISWIPLNDEDSLDK